MTTYIYSLSDPRTNEMRYIGKSESPNRRLFCHMTHARTGRDRSKKGRWMRGLDKLGLYPILAILAEVEGDGCDQEIEFIRRGWDKGLKLLNMTPGGDGVIQTPEIIAKRMKTFRERMANDPEFRNSIRERGKRAGAKMRGKKQDPEMVRRRAAKMKGRQFSPETRAKMSAWQVGRKLPPETIAKLSASKRGRKQNKEWVVKRTSARLGRPWNPKPLFLFTATKQAQRVLAPQSRCGFRGVGFHKRSGKWRAYFKKQHLGLYSTATQAALAYDAAACEAIGESAILNFRVTLSL